MPVRTSPCDHRLAAALLNTLVMHLSLQLIAEKFPWFLDTWFKYPYNIQRADVLRYFVLYEYGGIYLVGRG